MARELGGNHILPLADPPSSVSLCNRFEALYLGISGDDPGIDLGKRSLEDNLCMDEDFIPIPTL